MVLRVFNKCGYFVIRAVWQGSQVGALIGQGGGIMKTLCYEVDSYQKKNSWIILSASNIIIESHVRLITLPHTNGTRFPNCEE